jgi:hypothetical protein
LRRDKAGFRVVELHGRAPAAGSADLDHNHNWWFLHLSLSIYISIKYGHLEIGTCIEITR